MRQIFTLIHNIIKRAVISKLEVDSETSPIAQASYLGKTGTTEIVLPYGISARAPVGTQLLLFAVQGQENNRAAIPYGQENRHKNLEEGEVVIENEITKSFIKFDKDGNITVDSKAKIVINCVGDADITVGGKVVVNSTGDIDVTTNGKVDLKATGNVDVDAPQVNLGSGGAAIARVGDSVNLTTGLIITGGNNTSI